MSHAAMRVTNGEPENTPDLGSNRTTGRDGTHTGATVTDSSITDAFEAAYAELGFDSDDTPEGTVDQPEETEVEAPEDDAEDVEPEVESEETDEDAEEDGGEDEESEPVVIEVVEGATLRLPDGTEVPADKAVLFQQAWTKKTTELAEQRREFEQEREAFVDLQAQVEQTYEDMSNWYQARVSDPAGWINEIALESENPTQTVAKALFDLARSGKLDRRFVETFGIEEGVVAEIAQEASREDEVAALRERLDAQERRASEEAEVQQKVAEYQRQWGEIKLVHGASFESAAAEQEAKRELMEFAVARKLTHNLTDAYLLMQAVKPQSQAPEPAPTPDPATTAKKRALSAVNPRSTAGGGGVAEKAVPKDARSAALEALAEFGL
jgi:hypothetical protein